MIGRVLQLAGEFGGSLTRFAVWVVWIAQCPGHLARGAVEGRFGSANAFSLFVENRGLLDGESERLDDRRDAFTKLQVEKTCEETFACDFGFERQGVLIVRRLATAGMERQIGDVELAQQGARELCFEMEFFEG